MKNWLKENWFKVTIIILLSIFIAIYGYGVYKQNQPKNLEEKVWQEIQKR